MLAALFQRRDIGLNPGHDQELIASYAKEVLLRPTVGGNGLNGSPQGGIFATVLLHQAYGAASALQAKNSLISCSWFHLFKEWSRLKNRGDSVLNTPEKLPK